MEETEAAADGMGGSDGYLVVVYEAGCGWICEFRREASAVGCHAGQVKAEERAARTRLLFGDESEATGHLLAEVEAGSDREAAEVVVDKYLRRTLGKDISRLEALDEDGASNLCANFGTRVRAGEIYRCQARGFGEAWPPIRLAAQPAPWYAHLFDELSNEANPWRSPAQREAAANALASAKEESQKGNHSHAYHLLNLFSKKDKVEKFADPLENVSPTSPSLGETGGSALRPAGSPLRAAGDIPSTDDPGLEGDMFGALNVAPAVEDEAAEEMADTNAVNWSYTGYREETGARRDIKQIVRMSEPFGQPVSLGRSEAEDKVKAALQKLTLDEKKADNLNRLRYEAVSEKLDKILAFCAANADAIMEIKEGAVAGNGRNRKRILSRKAKKLMRRLSMPFEQMAALEEAFGPKVAITEELVDAMRNGDADADFWIYFVDTMLSDDMAGRVIHCTAGGKKKKPDLKVHSRALGIEFGKFSINFLKFVYAYVKRTDAYMELPKSKQRAYLVKIDRAIKNKLQYQRSSRIEQRRRLCIRKIKKEEPHWKTALLYILDDQLFKNTKLKNEGWPKTERDNKMFVERYMSRIEVASMEKLRPKLPPGAGTSFSEVGHETILQLALNNKLRARWYPTEEDLAKKKQKAAQRKAARERAKEREEVEVDDPGVVADGEESGSQQMSQLPSQLPSQSIIASSQETVTSTQSRKSSRMRKSNPKYKDGHKEKGGKKGKAATLGSQA